MRPDEGKDGASPAPAGRSCFRPFLVSRIGDPARAFAGGLAMAKRTKRRTDRVVHGAPRSFILRLSEDGLVVTGGGR